LCASLRGASSEPASLFDLQRDNGTTLASGDSGGAGGVGLALVALGGASRWRGWHLVNVFSVFPANIYNTTLQKGMPEREKDRPTSRQK
jgi:uncharacterized membrane protein